MTKLIIDKITKSYEGENTIENISLEVFEGETVCLFGPSGVGKTTLFNVIAGLLAADSGKIFLNGEDITGKNGKISYMHQKDLLLPYKKVIDNIALPLIIRGQKKEKAREVVMPYLLKFGLSGYENKYPNALSGGMRQRAALLRTYFFGTELFLLDEPFSALDAITKLDMQKWFLHALSEISDGKKISMIIITHDIEEAVYMSDKICILKGKPGQIVKEIDLSYISDKDSFMLSEDYLKLKKSVLEIL